MILTCEECSTSFNLDDSIVKDTGTKVRCSVCKHIFTAFPETPAEPVAVDEPIGLDFEPGEPADDTADFTPDDSFDSDLSFEDDNLSLEMDEPELSLDSSDLSLETETPADASSDFSFDDDLTLDDGGLELEADTFDVAETSLEPEELSLEMETEDQSVEEIEAEDDFSFQPDDFDVQTEDSEPELELELDESIDDLEFEIADEDTDPVEPDFDIEQDLTLEEPVDDIEFEPLTEEDDQTDDPDFNEGESSLTPAEEEPIDEEAFELEFDFEEDEVKPREEPTADTDDDSDPPIITPEADFSEYEDVLEQETEPEEPEEEAPVEMDAAEESNEDASQTTLAGAAVSEEPSRKHRRQTQKKPLIGTPVLILILLFLLVIGAYVASHMTGYKIKYLSDIEIPYVTAYMDKYLPKKTPPVMDAKPTLNQKSVNGRFVTNNTAGNLFVITGRVENQSDRTFRFIEIKGSLSTKEAIEAKTKVVFAGNLITEEMLKSGNIEEIEKLLVVKEGRHNSNAQIKPGATVPFMLVFSDYPEDQLQNFVVRIHKFEPMPPAGSN